jgi:hypothetical protein
VVVAVGFTVIDPLESSDAYDPGVMTMLLAPVVTQLSVAPAPVPTVPGFAVNEEMVGLAAEAICATGATHPASSPEAISRMASAKIPGRDDFSSRKPRFRPEQYLSK